MTDHETSQELIAELEARLTQLANQLQTANASLEREIADHMGREDEFRRSTDQLRKLSTRLQSSVREEERTHIARAIHDELGQGLNRTKNGCSLAAKAFGSTTASADRVARHPSQVPTLLPPLEV